MSLTRSGGAWHEQRLLAALQCLCGLVGTYHNIKDQNIPVKEELSFLENDIKEDIEDAKMTLTAMTSHTIGEY